eukprot:TRINITY_DN2660_c0_g1_i7.p1 TRINITY_DN2660_c0_g1~~TRINITY_DN2660_c0_g1_i7.p1  ORF type:complete len:150 (+),score=53.52 TRINITY_DN2660_c0_g1_i7:148-597(+)
MCIRDSNRTAQRQALFSGGHAHPGHLIARNEDFGAVTAQLKGDLAIFQNGNNVAGVPRFQILVKQRHVRFGDATGQEDEKGNNRQRDAGNDQQPGHSEVAKDVLHVGAPSSILDSALALADPVLCVDTCLLYTSPSPRDRTRSRMPSSA